MAPKAEIDGYPGGTRFAFTILDDTDDSTLANVKPIYDLFIELGMRTTKTVWALDCPPEQQGPFFAAETLQDSRYLSFVKTLVQHGFEIAFHNATMATSTREQTMQALAFLQREFGFLPTLHCNHGRNRENVYWGPQRYHTWPIRAAATLVARILRQPRFEGEKTSSQYFIGDICRQQFRFVRSFAFRRLNSGRIPPGGPYTLPSTPWVNYWFCSADAPDVHAFKQLVTTTALDRLCRNSGVCILSTHLGKGFVRNGKVDDTVEKMLRYAASLPGWFAPTSSILEHLLLNRPNSQLSTLDRWRLELGHIFDRILGGLSSHATL